MIKYVCLGCGVKSSEKELGVIRESRSEGWGTPSYTEISGIRYCCPECECEDLDEIWEDEEDDDID